MKLEEIFTGFFNLEKGNFNFYFPGLKKVRDGYELDFHSFANRLQKIKPKLIIKRIGINCNKDTIEARSDLDGGLVGDLYNLTYNGVLFLPRFSTWDRDWKFNKVSCLTKLIEKCSKGSGIFAYKVNEEIHQDRIGEFSDKVRKLIREFISLNEGNDSHYFIKF